MNNLLFLDTETTGLTPEDRIIELAYMQNGYEKPAVELFDPGLPIKFEAMATHHITQKMIEGLPSLKDWHLKTDIQDMLDKNVMVAHNAAFDKEMLEREGLTVPHYICTLKLAQFLLDEPTYKMQVLRYKYGIEIEGIAHTASGDVAVLEKVFNFLFEKSKEVKPISREFISWAEQISVNPLLLRRIGFGKHKGTPFAKVPKDYLQWLVGDRAKNPSPSSDPDRDLDYTLNYYLTN